jgi:serine/threonine protein kinase
MLIYIGACKITTFSIPEYYILTDYKAGYTLENYLSNSHLPNNPLLKERSQIIQKICIPLAEIYEQLHLHGIVHGGYSPKDLLLNTTEKSIQPILLNWEKARNIPMDRINDSSQDYFKRGSYDPEQIIPRGSPPEFLLHLEPHVATDLYFLGQIYYFLLSNGAKLPKFALTEDYILHLNQIDSKIPAALNELIENLTQYEPWKRVESAQKVIETLKAFT